MFEVYKSPDPFERFIEICDECIEEINIEAQRKLYKEKDFNCLYCLYHEKRSGCMYHVCLLTPDKAVCGCMTLASAWRFIAFEIDDTDFIEKVNQYIYSCKRRKVNNLSRLQSQRFVHQTMWSFEAAYIRSHQNLNWPWHILFCIPASSFSFHSILYRTNVLQIIMNVNRTLLFLYSK